MALKPTDAKLKKGDTGEADFKVWLNRNGFGYLTLCQSQKDFAHTLQGDVKRPDFLVLIEGLGLIAVDVKFCARVDGKYPLETEFRKALVFEQVFRMPVWYAYRGTKLKEWLWISLHVATAVHEPCTRPDLRVLDPKHLLSITKRADFGKLYTQRMPGYGKLATEP